MYMYYVYMMYTNPIDQPVRGVSTESSQVLQVALIMYITAERSARHAQLNVSFCLKCEEFHKT